MRTRSFGPSLPPIAGMVLSAILLAVSSTILIQDLGWWGLAAAAGAMLAGTWIRGRFIVLPRLKNAEAAWAAGKPASEVLSLLPNTGGGELGRQIHLLRGRASAALGYRDGAWAAFREADPARMAWPLRALIRPFFRSLPEAPSAFRMRAASFLSRLTPRSARLHHLIGLLHLRRDESARAWERFETALPLASEDPLLLDDLM